MDICVILQVKIQYDFISLFAQIFQLQLLEIFSHLLCPFEMFIVLRFILLVFICVCVGGGYCCFYCSFVWF